MLYLIILSKNHNPDKEKYQDSNCAVGHLSFKHFYNKMSNSLSVCYDMYVSFSGEKHAHSFMVHSLRPSFYSKIGYKSRKLWQKYTPRHERCFYSQNYKTEHIRLEQYWYKKK